MKKLILSLILLISLSFCIQQGYAQDTTKNFIKKHNVVLIARCYGDSVVLRWAPQDPAVWMLGNSYGWYIRRSLSEAEYQAQTGEKREIEKTLNYGKPITPYTLVEFQTAFDSTNLFAGAAAQALYGPGAADLDPNSSFTNYVFRKDQEQHQRQYMAYMAAEGRPEIATALGLRFVDYDVKKGHWYEYSLSSPIPKRYAEIYEPSIIVENVPYVRQEDEMMPKITVEQIDEYRAIIYWERNKLSGFYVERSKNGGKWEKMNEVPVFGYDPDEGSFAVHGEAIANLMYSNVVIFDSLDLKTTYKYRVKAFDAFGDYLPYKESEKFEMIDAIPPTPPVIMGCDVQDNKVCTIYWQKDNIEDDFDGYILTFSDSPDGPWEHVSDVIDKKAIKYVDEQAGERGRGYYRLFAFDKLKNVSFSGTAINNIEDVIPPTQPTGFKALVDTAGIAVFTWNKNPEKDVMGYRVFFANQMDHEFVECSHGLTHTNEFIDTLDWNTITKFAYYYIVAEDYSHNVSVHSDTIAVPVPDRIAPTPCILKDITVEGNAVVIKWSKSASNDVMYYFIYRKLKKQQQWNLLQVVEPWQIVDADDIIMIDYPSPSSSMYQYSIEAIDDFHNSEGRQGLANAFVREETIVNIPIELAATANKKDNSIKLEWAYNYENRHGHYGVIYRSINDGEFVDIANFEQGVTSFVDKDVNSNDRAKYFIVLYLGKGQRSTPSETVSAKL